MLGSNGYGLLEAWYQGLKFVKFAINLAKGGNTMIGAHEAHDNIFFSSQELVRRHCY